MLYILPLLFLRHFIVMIAKLAKFFYDVHIIFLFLLKPVMLWRHKIALPLQDQQICLRQIRYEFHEVLSIEFSYNNSWKLSAL